MNGNQYACLLSFLKPHSLPREILWKLSLDLKSFFEPVFFPFGPIAGVVVGFIHISYRDSQSIRNGLYVYEND